MSHWFEIVFQTEEGVMKSRESFKKVKRIGKDKILSSYPQPAIEYSHKNLPDNLDSCLIKDGKIVFDFKSFKIDFMRKLRRTRNRKLRELDHEYIQLFSQDFDLTDIKYKQKALRDITSDDRLNSRSKAKYNSVMDDLRKI